MSGFSLNSDDTMNKIKHQIQKAKILTTNMNKRNSISVKQNHMKMKQQNNGNNILDIPTFTGSDFAGHFNIFCGQEITNRT